MVAPVFTNDGSAVSFTEGSGLAVAGTPVVIDSNIVVTDGDDGNAITAAVVTVTNFQTGDVLAATMTGGITIASNANGVLTLTGSGTSAQYTSVLQSVTFANTSDAPNTTARNVTFSATDGSGAAVAATPSAITVVATNDAPVLADTVLTLAGGNEDNGAPVNGVTAGVAVTTLVGGITDPDGGAPGGIAIVGKTSAANGTVYFSTDSGTTWTALGTVSGSSATLLTNAATNRLYFEGATNVNGTISDVVTVRGWDATTGANGATGVDASTNGGVTPYSAATDTVAMTLAAVNDAPVNTVSGARSVGAGDAITLTGLGLVDVDAAGGTMTTTISVTSGTIEGTSQGGAVVTGAGTATVTLTGTAAQINTTLTATSNLQYRTAPGFTGAVTATVVSNDADNIDGGFGNDTVSGGDGSDTVRGLEDNDNIDGGTGDDDVNGNTGTDTVRGGDGNDTVRGGQDNDEVYGDAGNDGHVNGNMGNDTVRGGDGNDTVYGGQGNDYVYGDAGNDQLSGDLGNDILYDGAGGDRFAMRVGGGQDWIGDFNYAEGDRILLVTGQTYSVSTYQGQTLLTLANGDTIGLAGVSTFSADYVVFA